MGRDNKEKWLKELKDSVLDHSEPLPDSFWEELDKSVPAPVPAGHYRKVRRLLIAASVAAVAVAVLLLDLPKGDGDGAYEEYEEYVARVEQDTVRETVQEVMEMPAVGKMAVAEEDVRETTADDKDEKNDKYYKYEKIVAEVKDVAVVAADVVADTVDDEKGNLNDADAKGEDNVAEKEEDKVAEKGVEKDGKVQDRAEYLKELEYLYGNDTKLGKKERGRIYVAFAGGNAGIKVKNPFKGGEMVSSGIPNGAANMSPTIAGFVNMDYQPAGEVEWVGTLLNSASAGASSFTSCGYDHSVPVRFGVSIAKEIAGGIFVESGVSYQYLKSRMHQIFGITQKLHYLGVPVRVSATVAKAGSFSLYLAGGYLLEKCIYGVLEHDNGRDERLALQQWQNSLNASLGMQLKLGGGASLYLEPGAYWYLGMKNGWIAKQKGFLIRNAYSDDPEGFSFQGGLRFAF